MDKYQATERSKNAIEYFNNGVHVDSQSLNSTEEAVQKLIRNTPSPFRMGGSPPNVVMEEDKFKLSPSLSFRAIARKSKPLSAEKLNQQSALKKLEELKNRYTTFEKLLKIDSNRNIYSSALRGCIVSLKEIFMVSCELSEVDGAAFLPQFLKWTEQTNSKVADVLPKLYNHLSKYMMKTIKTHEHKTLVEKMNALMQSTLMENFLDCCESLEKSHLSSPVSKKQQESLMMCINRYLQKN